MEYTNYIQYNYKLDTIHMWDTVIGFEHTVPKFSRLLRKMSILVF